MDRSEPPQPRIVGPSRTKEVLRALLFGSSVCAGMLATRMIWGHATRFGGLFGNLLLAWIPLLLALYIRRVAGERERRRSFWVASVLWFLFFPNCFYLVTDLTHMRKFGSDGVAAWYDMMMTIAFASA